MPPQAHQRNLQSSNVQAQPIRVTIDYSIIDRIGAGITQQQKQYLIRIMEIAKIYLSKLLKVYPTQGRNMFSRYWGQSCIDINVSQQDLQYGIADSDLHLYVVYVNNLSEGYLANAGYCSMSDTYLRPNYGRVNFNIARMGPFSGDSEQFENNLETTIHEIIHVLGFSGSAIRYWIDPQTNQPYGNNVGKITKSKTVRGRQATILFSKNVLETTRKYYNCPSADGMQLENEGGGGSLGSHWEKAIIHNELMSPSASLTDAQLSVFTIALLKDTGFYAEVNENMSDFIYWGNSKGCEFLNNACFSRQQFPEFPSNSSTQQCTFEYEGIGVGYQDKFSDGCQVISPYSNRLCTNTKNQYDQGTNSRLEYFGNDSRCFQSTATDPSMMGSSQTLKCHKFKCSADRSSITIFFTQINKNVVCSLSQAGSAVYIDPNNKGYGQIACPSDFNRFCNFTPICPNFCSENGICVRGQCICNQGYGNFDCSQQCNTPLVENNKCVIQCSQGNYVNPDNTCKNSCPKQYFPKNGRCEPCHSTCSSCTDERPTSCLSCQFLTLLQNGSCVSQCNTAQGYVQNDRGECVNNSIPDCKVQNCKQCDQNNQKCVQCKPNLFLNSTFQCVQQCPYGQFADTQSGKCLDCTLYLNDCTKCTNSATCTQCSNNKVLQNGKCQDSTPTPQCSANCSQCLNSQKCIKCSSGFFLDYTYNCVKQCYPGQFPSSESQMCENCNIYLGNCSQCKSKDECTQCEKEKVLQNGKCIDPTQQCSSNCASCENATKCTKCSKGYFLDYKLQCVEQCYQGQFANPTSQWCENCNLYISGCSLCINETKCTQCQAGKQLSQGKCVDVNNGCPVNCSTCENASKCTKCSSGYFLDYQFKCISQCYQGQFANPTSQWCENCNLFITGCSLCTSATQCTQCDSGKQLSQGKCIDVNNGCSANCSICENANKCTKCSSGYFLDYQFKCVTQCYPGQFANPTSQWCENCNVYLEGCVDCTAQNKCLKCDNTKGYVLNGTACAKGRSLKENIKRKNI